MVATATATPAGCEVEIVNDLFGCRKTIHSDRTRAEIIEEFLFGQGRESPGPEPPLAGCLHIYRDRLVVHFFGLPGREEEALAALREGVGGVE